MHSTIWRVIVLEAWAFSATDTKPGSQPGFLFETSGLRVAFRVWLTQKQWGVSGHYPRELPYIQRRQLGAVIAEPRQYIVEHS